MNIPERQSRLNEARHCAERVQDASPQDFSSAAARRLGFPNLLEPHDGVEARGELAGGGARR